ncbi:hypothetical protein [Sporosarcina luteola]|nr:hypothetical protein [Sporosarcina luteola]
MGEFMLIGDNTRQFGDNVSRNGDKLVRIGDNTRQFGDNHF